MKKLELEKKNFRVNSSGWKKIIVDNETYLINPEKDIWEITKGEYKGEQLFTYKAAIRETKKAGKRMPTDEEFETLQKKDIPNIAYVGYRYTYGSFYAQGTSMLLWSSTKNGASAWRWDLLLGCSTLHQYTYDKANGVSVRCVSKRKISQTHPIIVSDESLKLEKKNFKVNSNSWKKIIVDDETYLINPKKDIWEITKGEYKGEQLFTYNAAIRETKKAGKRIPTDKEFSTIRKKNIPNITYVGYHNTNGSFSDRGTYMFMWSSTESGASAWKRVWGLGYSSIYQNPYDKADGVSVRCLSK